ncbi:MULTISPECIES: MBL fold metallo-hydrolase [Fusobacterium]|uniref:MBL fold metallo-hydrolase n=1 Tax=Fusobacterium TaxID=848 RepID=UPI001476C31F|nr:MULTISPECIES: MBL fold metallo-hydrolase [Fusobacterium]NME35848.1 MBL fold metallo-hydrolase [Fusobacterium sp. FSA-380-WT-3A]
MNIKRFYTGGFMTNSYLLWDENNEAYLFDCEGERIDKIIDFIDEKNLELKYIILTHGHSDHICGLNAVKEVYPEAKVFIGDEDAEFLVDPSKSHSNYIFGINFIYKGSFKRIKDGDVIGKFLVIDTPGHTRGSKCFFDKESKILISGDTMFRRSFGRYDFPESSGEQLFNSLRRLCKLPSETVVYSGHTESTTIGEERIFLTSLGII